jgi:hypothetical protein
MAGTGYCTCVNSFNVDLLTVMGVLAGLSALLFLMAAIDPSNEQRTSPVKTVDRDVVVPPRPRAEQSARGA